MAARFVRSLDSVVAPLVTRGVGSPLPVGVGLVTMGPAGPGVGRLVHPALTP